MYNCLLASLSSMCIFLFFTKNYNGSLKQFYVGLIGVLKRFPGSQLIRIGWLIEEREPKKSIPVSVPIPTLSLERVVN